MRSIEFKESNQILLLEGSPEDAIPVWYSPPTMVSCWTGNIWQRLYFLIFGKMWVLVTAPDGAIRPSFSITVDYPFEENKGE